MKKLTIVTFVVMMFTGINILPAQIDLPQVVPPAPNAAKLVQFDITPTSPYTGRQNLSVPLYSINFEGGQFPISINYSSGGIKASEEAGYVGLGWALSFGGSISRSVSSLNDIRGGGWLFDDQVIPETYNPDVLPQGEIDGTPTTQHPFWLYISGGSVQKDTEPDIFNYNFMGYSGSFVLPKGIASGEAQYSAAGSAYVIKLEEDPTRIYFDNTGKFFRIDTPEGFIGEFKVTEWVTSIGGSDPDSGGPLTGCEFGQVDILEVMNTNRRAITTWYLSKVTSPNGRILNFEYDLNSNDYSDYMSQSAYNFGEKMSVDGAWQATPNNTQSCSYTIIEHVYPKRIYSTYNGIDINFTYANRDDLEKLQDYHVNFAQERGEISGSTPTFTIKDPKRVTGFTVGSTNSLSSLNHVISFSQNYFNSSSSNAYQMKRLKLDGVTVDDQVYSFEYENGQSGLPDKSTFGVDYWGYYNGKTSNTSLIPVGISYTTPTRFLGPSINTYLPNDLFYYQNDNRKADFNHGKAGLLNKVTYPTGGFTEYDYEAHEYRLEGREIVPVSGNESATAAGSYTVATTSTSSNVQYNGYIIVGGSCNSAVYVSYSISCPNHYSGGTCDLPFSTNTWNIPALEIVDAGSGNTVYQKNFSELGSAQSGSNPAYNVSGTAYVNLTPGTYYVRAKSVATADSKFARGNIYISYPKSCSSAYTPSVNQSDSDMTAGGARIKTITNYSGTGNVTAKRSYEYKDFDAGTQFSTGRLMNPLMNFSISRPPGTNSLLNFYAFMSGSVLSDGGVAQGSHIGYTWVREHFEGSGAGNIGFTDYNYLNESNVPGYYGLSSKSTYGHSNGQMDESSVYNSSGLRQTKTDNNNIVENLTNDIKGVKVDWLGGSPGIMETYTLDRHFVTPKQVVTTTYLNGKTMTQTQNRTFNGTYQLASENSTGSDGDIISNLYKYVTDYSSPTGVTASMVNAHRIGSPVEHVTMVNGTAQSAMGTAHKAVGSNFLPDKIYTYNPDLSAYVASGNGYDFGTGYEERLEYKLYDSYGNIREFVNEAGVSTTILWGYGGAYPVAQIQNATYAEVSPLITQSALDSPASQTALRSTLDALRTHANMKKAQVTTMTYDPGVGILSKTSPNGISSFYEYDTYGRLIRIKDRDGNIVKLVEYGYKQAIPASQN